MPDCFWDLETRSAANLRTVGPWVYAAHATTEILCLCYAIDDGEVQTWLPGQLVPEPFLASRDPNGWRLIAHNYEFERALLERVLTLKHGFPSISLESQHCSMAVALANAYPGELETLAAALELPYRKDREGWRLMRLMSRPRKPKKGEDKSVLYWVFDAEKLQRLITYCAQDVRTARAIWQHSKLKLLIENERRLQILDARINRRGVRADRLLATNARDLAVREREAINAALREHTDGAITSVDQVSRILAYAVERGHEMTSVGRRSVSAVLAAGTDTKTRRVLELRRDGARASVRKYERILAYASDTDDRLRGTMRMYGAGPGRWVGRGPQLQNLKKNESNLPLEVVDAVRAEDRAQLLRYGNPLTVLGDIARAVICAAPGSILMAADFGAIESRILGWVCGEEWKLQAYRDFDSSGDKAKEPYRIIAARMLKRDDPAAINKEERNKGKAGELAAGFGGSVGAWRRIAPEDKRPDAEILGDIHAWRTAHPKTTAYWRELTRAIRIAIRTGQPIAARAIVAEFENGNLYLALPSGRRITYPHARLIASKYEGYPPDVTFKDNARGKWSDYRGWFGTFIENVVQGIARDLLAAAIERFEARGIPIVLHVHDECVGEVRAGLISETEFLEILLEAPPWATGLPLAGKVWSGPHYLEPPEELWTPPANTGDPPDAGLMDDDEPDEPGEPTADDGDSGDDHLVSEENEFGDALAPLFDLASGPLSADRKIQCPFHTDDLPSLQFYADHFHCFGCGEHGDRIDWLTRGEGMTHEAAIELIHNWNGPPATRSAEGTDTSTMTQALELWAAARSIEGTPAAGYLTHWRGVDVAALPSDLDAILRFHPNCPFSPGVLYPCLLALFRDIATDAPAGIHRIALGPDGNRIERRMLGRWPMPRAIKLWPRGERLIVAEGLETAAAAATRVPYRGEPLRPAWALAASGNLARLPVLPDVRELIILVDHDTNGEGQAAAADCALRWSRAGRRCIRLTPKAAGADFNDLVPRQESVA